MSIELKQAAQHVVDAFDVFSDADDFVSLFALTQKMRALREAIQQAETQQPATGEPVQAERDQLRCAQADAVMPLIGPLLDAWENADREVMSQEPELSKQLKNINSAMEDAETHPASSVPEGYALVPIEPTQAMMNVQTWDFSSFYSPREIWAAMLAAKKETP